MKNLMGKTRKADEPYLTLYDPRNGYRTKVLKSWQGDDTKRFARWFVQVVSPATGSRGDLGDSYVLDILGGQEDEPDVGIRVLPERSPVQVEQFDPAIIDQVRPVLEAYGVTI